MRTPSQTVGEVMTSPVVTVQPNALIEDALEIMLRERISGLPVVDSDGRLVGILTEYDALKLLADPDPQFWPVEPVAHYMTTDVLCVEIDARLLDVAVLLLDESVRRLPVLEEGQVVGIVARRDVVQALGEAHRASLRRVLPECLPTEA